MSHILTMPPKGMSPVHRTCIVPLPQLVKNPPDWFRKEHYFNTSNSNSITLPRTM